MIHSLVWDTRAEATIPAGVVALGPVAKRLLVRLKAQADGQLDCLSIVAARNILVILGSADQLPWVDGVRYCAPDPVSPGLWLPTTDVSRISPDLLQSAMLTKVKRMPVLLWNEPEQILPLDRPLTLTMPVLDWLMQEMD